MAATDQSRAALASANERRLIVARLKRLIADQDARTGKLLVAEVLRECPPELARVRVGAVLGSVRAVGDTKLRKYQSRTAVGMHLRLGDLTENQRRRLAHVLTVKS